MIGDKRMTIGNESKTEKLTLTVSQTANLLGLSRNSVYQGIFAGEIPHIKVGKRILVPRIALECLLNGAGKEVNDA